MSDLLSPSPTATRAATSSLLLSPAAPTFRLAFARTCDHAAVDALRIAAYKGAPYFELKDTQHLLVEEDPASSVVLCAWENDNLAATVRLAAASDSAQAADLLGFALPQTVDLPAAVFSRGAVDPGYRGQGWMPFLLTLGVRLSRRIGLRCALGAQAAGTPHQGAMLRSGWKVRDVGRMSHEALDMKSTAQFLWLDCSQFDNTVLYGLNKAQPLLSRCDVPALTSLSDQFLRLSGRWQLPRTTPALPATGPKVAMHG